MITIGEIRIELIKLLGYTPNLFVSSIVYLKFCCNKHYRIAIMIRMVIQNITRMRLCKFAYCYPRLLCGCNLRWVMCVVPDYGEDSGRKRKINRYKERNSQCERSGKFIQPKCTGVLTVHTVQKPRMDLESLK